MPEVYECEIAGCHKDGNVTGYHKLKSGAVIHMQFCREHALLPASDYRLGIVVLPARKKTEEQSSQPGKPGTWEAREPSVQGDLIEAVVRASSYIEKISEIDLSEKDAIRLIWKNKKLRITIRDDARSMVQEIQGHMLLAGNNLLEDLVNHGLELVRAERDNRNVSKERPKIDELLKTLHQLSFECHQERKHSYAFAICPMHTCKQNRAMLLAWGIAVE